MIIAVSCSFGIHVKATTRHHSLKADRVVEFADNALVAEKTQFPTSEILGANSKIHSLKYNLKRFHTVFAEKQAGERENFPSRGLARDSVRVVACNLLTMS